MILKHLEIYNFRNYSSLQISLSNKINIFYGNNAQGKTNILESIFVLGLTKSHRSYIDNDLIKSNENQAKIKGIIEKDNFETSLEIFFDKKQKKYKINQDEIKKTSEYISNMNIIIFYPEDLDLIKGSPQDRRKFLNLELSQLYNNYYKVLNDYNKLLKIRNDCLKKKMKGNMIDENYFSIITEYLIEKSVFIYRARYKFLEKINQISTKIYHKIMNINNFLIKYITNFKFDEYTESEIKEKMQTRFENEKENEIRYGTTLFGPHRDDFEFYIENENLKNFGSQGQQRIAVISIKLSEIEIFKSQCSTNPILLLDDVFSELDDNKKNNLLQYIKEDIQTIITTTDLKNIDNILLKQSKLFEIKNGQVINIEEVE